MISRSSSAFSNCSPTRDGDTWFRSYSSSATTQIEGEICTRRRLRVISAYAYIHIDTHTASHRAVGPALVRQPVGRPVRGSPRTGSGALSTSSDVSWMLASCSESNPDMFEDQVAVVAWLETFMCTDPLRRASRLRFLVFMGFQRRSASFTSCSTSPARTHDGTELHRIISTFVCNTTCSSPSVTTLTWTSTP